jgi:opacity protein-like surface antigen
MKQNYFLKVATLVVALVMVGFNAYAQEAGEMAAGGNVGVNIGDGVTNFGIGGKFQYNVAKVGTGIIRGEGAFTYYLGDFSFWDLSVNGHYLIKLPTPKLAVYPLAGLSIVGFGNGGSGDDSGGWYLDPVTGEKVPIVYPEEEDDGEGGGSSTFIGFNLGGGVQYELKPNILLLGELKYRIAEVGVRGLGVSVGLVYKF